MCRWLLGAEVRHLCLDNGYDYPQFSSGIYVNGFQEYHRNPVRHWRGTNICLVEGFSVGYIIFTNNQMGGYNE